ncbi:TetR/AcrR family transcriptional regulator C-terminal domain-containing protein [Hoyosella sp. YIM 151337]|uniref:TetR/AcrR family transcriptional regulator C-terminal domain-containing protein n=1 Tax=Hoyosella sp. YIM 151337 TaxID=2992742 RepID=UPI002235477A|nr:TetR/AcrR family transcriptional regulator C-terminal domain-containing protein [Hoyosella sp. YIM 151337]MCW4355445.1 TetR/AcrR family transcriptional regulator C-terminal domain-containing protein [Hoyosella sp. YIM 151337]
MGRPPRRLLTADWIADEALKMVDESGDFTMPGIAGRLKVRPSSLYNHVSGRSEIIELLRARMMAQIDVEQVRERAAEWPELVLGIAREYRRSYAQHPRLIPLLTATTVQTEVAFGMYNALADAFTDAGFAPAEVLHAITSVDSYVLGSALDVAAPEEVWATPPEAGEAMRAAVSAAGTMIGRADAAFEFGLQALVRGLVVLAEPVAAPE